MAAENKLSDRQLKALQGKSQTKQRLISDGRGMSARVSKNGAVSFVMFYRLGGRDTSPIWLTLGKYPDMSLKMARDKRDECRAWLAEGIDPRHRIGLITDVSKNLMRNKVQVIQQFEQTGSHANRYDVTILVNGLPLAQIELKKRGVAIREAFNQIHRYSKESFNSNNSLFKYLQLFVISNGTDTRYFANTTRRDKNSFDFTMNWAKSDNTL
ncbi:type I restriction endonuclease, partial [Klebsiella pneumoniae]